MNANVSDPFCESLVVSSDEAMALARACLDMGQVELAARWERFAQFLFASETYVEPSERA